MGDNVADIEELFTVRAFNAQARSNRSMVTWRPFCPVLIVSINANFLENHSGARTLLLCRSNLFFPAVFLDGLPFGH